MTDIPRRALGRKPKANKAALAFGDFLTVVPEHPIASDPTAGVAFGLDRNDEFGVCVPTGKDNYCRTVTKALTGVQRSMTQEQVFADYRTQNPGFDPALAWNDPRQEDNGMVIQDYLAMLAKRGDILGFAKVDVSNDDLLTAAEYLFLGILWGVDLDVAQQSQTDRGTWDYVAGSPSWGGHCTVTPVYSGDDRQRTVTWAELVWTTDAFRRRQLDEAWVILLPEHIANPGFRARYDLAKFAQAYTDITGRPFPVDVPPPPPPPPPPPVEPPPDAAGCLVTALRRFLASKACPGYLRKAAQDWLTSLGL